jgi:hypothetical protein
MDTMKPITNIIEYPEGTGNEFEIQYVVPSYKFYRWMATQTIEKKIEKIEPDDPILIEIVQNCKAQWREAGIGEWQTDFSDLPPAVVNGWIAEITRHGAAVAKVKVEQQKN